MADPVDLAAIRAFLGPAATAGNCVSARLCDEVERLRLLCWERDRALEGERASREAAVRFSEAEGFRRGTEEAVLFAGDFDPLSDAWSDEAVAGADRVLDLFVEKLRRELLVSRG